MSTDLFGDVQEAPPRADEPVQPDAVKARPPTYEQNVKEQYGLPHDWRLVSWELKGSGASEYLEIEGGVFREKITKGPRTGAINFKKPEPGTPLTAALLLSTHEQWLARWQTETGHCAACFGTGQAWQGWGIKTGNRYKPCSKCGATGLSAGASP